MALNTMYNFSGSEERKQSLNIDFAFQQANDKQGDVVRNGNASKFYNMNAAYNIHFVPEAISLNGSINTTINKASGDKFVIVGPTIGVRAKILRKMITTGVNSSYNVNYSEGKSQGKVMNIRLNFSYVMLKKHNFSINTIWQQRSNESGTPVKSTTALIAYALNI
jgi:hypothetical protein